MENISMIPHFDDPIGRAVYDFHFNSVNQHFLFIQVVQANACP